jgi:hypothetical protein
MGKKNDERFIVETKPNSKEITKIIDTKSPKYHKPSGSQAPTLDDLLSIEFNVPDVSLSAFDNYEEFEKFQKAIMKRADKYFEKQSDLTHKADDYIDMLMVFLEKHPEMFAENSHEISRDMTKWALAEHMAKCRALIDRIQEIEKDLNLEMHHKW